MHDLIAHIACSSLHVALPSPFADKGSVRTLRERPRDTAASYDATYMTLRLDKTHVKAILHLVCM